MTSEVSTSQQRRDVARLALIELQKDLVEHLCRAPMQQDSDPALLAATATLQVEEHRNYIENRIADLMKSIPPISATDIWSKEQLQRRVSALREDINIYRTKLARHKRQYDALAVKYRRQREFANQVRCNLWRSLCEIVATLESQGMRAAPILNVFEDQWPQQGGDAGEGEPEDDIAMLDTQDPTLFDADEVQARIDEAVSKAQAAAEVKVRDAEQKLADTIAAQPALVAEAVNHACQERETEKKMFALLRREYENKIDELQEQLNTAQDEAEKRMEHARIIRESHVVGMSKTLAAAYNDLDRLRDVAKKLDEEVQKAADVEEQLKLELLHSQVDRKREAAGLRKLLLETKSKLDAVEPKERIIAAAVAPLNTLINKLVESKTTLDGKVRHLTTETEELRGMVSRYQQEAAEAQVQAHVRDARLHELEDQVTNARATAHEMRCAAEALTIDKAAADSTVADQAEKIKKQDATIAQLNANLMQAKLQVRKGEVMMQRKSLIETQSLPRSTARNSETWPGSPEAPGHSEPTATIETSEQSVQCTLIDALVYDLAVGNESNVDASAELPETPIPHKLPTERHTARSRPRPQRRRRRSAVEEPTECKESGAVVESASETFDVSRSTTSKSHRSHHHSTTKRVRRGTMPPAPPPQSALTPEKQGTGGNSVLSVERAATGLSSGQVRAKEQPRSTAAAATPLAGAAPLEGSGGAVDHLPSRQLVRAADIDEKVSISDPSQDNAIFSDEDSSTQLSSTGMVELQLFVAPCVSFDAMPVPHTCRRCNRRASNVGSSPTTCRAR